MTGFVLHGHTHTFLIIYIYIYIYINSLINDKHVMYVLEYRVQKEMSCLLPKGINTRWEEKYISMLSLVNMVGLLYCI